MFAPIDEKRQKTLPRLCARDTRSVLPINLSLLPLLACPIHNTPGWSQAKSACKKVRRTMPLMVLDSGFRVRDKVHNSLYTGRKKLYPLSSFQSGKYEKNSSLYTSHSTSPPLWYNLSVHILLIHQAFVSLGEAGGTRHHELARYLVQRGHRVTIICSPVSYLTGKVETRTSQEEEEGITIRRAYTYAALHRSFFHRVLAFVSFMLSSFWIGLSVRQVDLVWGTSPPIFQGVTAWALARLKGVPFLFEVRDLWPAFAIAMGVLRNPLLIGASQALERFLYRHADRVLVNSPGFIDHVTARGATWVELVPNGADPEMFDPAARGEAFRAAHGLDGHFVVLYAGAHGPSNDLGVVLDAAEHLQDEPRICFVLVGDGKEKPALMKQAQERGLKNVLFLPPAPKAQMGEIMAAADACLAILKPLELYKTTYPNKVFDAMAAGRAVVLAIDGVIRQVVEETGAGVFVPPGDAQALAQAVRMLADNPQAAREMGEAGRRCVERRFHRQVLAEQLALIMEQMGGENGRKNSGG